MQELSSAEADYLISWVRSKKNMLAELIKNVEDRNAPTSYIKRYLKGLGDALIRKSKNLGEL